MSMDLDMWCDTAYADLLSHIDPATKAPFTRDALDKMLTSNPTAEPVEVSEDELAERREKAQKKLAQIAALGKGTLPSDLQAKYAHRKYRS